MDSNLLYLAKLVLGLLVGHKLMFDPVSRSQFLRFIRQPGALSGIFGAHVDDDEDDDDEDYDPRTLRRRRRRGLEPSPFPKIPSDVGRDLMESGTFGTNDRLEGTYQRKSRLGNRIMQRELGLSSPGKERSRNKLAAQVSPRSGTTPLCIFLLTDTLAGLDSIFQR